MLLWRKYKAFSAKFKKKKRRNVNTITFLRYFRFSTRLSSQMPSGWTPMFGVSFLRRSRNSSRVLCGRCLQRWAGRG